MTTLRLVLGDQLSRSISSLVACNREEDVILIAEVREEATYVKHHKKKIAFLFAAMRHFADELRQEGFNIRYVRLDDSENTGSFSGEVARAVRDLAPCRIVATEPGEFRVLEMMREWSRSFEIPVEIRTDDRFFSSIQDFRAWAGNRRELRMEFFYREMRKRFGVLLDSGGRPAGGEWNYDRENRKPISGQRSFPKRISHTKSAHLREVLTLVEREFCDHFGELEPFHYAVNRKQALEELDQFIAEILPEFGDHQDAMVAGEPYLHHSLMSTYLNAGLLLPQEICEKAEAAYRRGEAPLNSVEGFIRQILGWREYVRGIYWLKMPDYADMNALEAREPLPWFYWNGETKMACIREAIDHSRLHAYSHHIQRLMITGNFALLAGIRPAEICEWYLSVYSDAYEWVELPNTLGMALYGDGGLMASKPYAASANYINKMSNFCGSCDYRPKDAVGEEACPFNSLYWDFMARNRSKLGQNQRMAQSYRVWERFDTDKKIAIRQKADAVKQAMREGTL